MPVALAACATVIIGCEVEVRVPPRGAARTASADVVANFREAAIPDDLSADVERATKLGRAIYENEAIASRSVEYLVDKQQPIDNVAFWLVWHVEAGEDYTGQSHLSVLLGTAENVPRLAYIVDGPAKFRRFEPPAPCFEGAAQEFIAERKALAMIPEPLPDRYECIAAAADGIGKEGGLVYVLSESTTPSDVVLGPHYRVHFDGTLDVTDVTVVADDRTVVSRAAGESVSGGDPPGIKTTLLGFSAPTEVQVLESLRHGSIPLLVSTSRGTWRVTGDMISFAAD